MSKKKLGIISAIILLVLVVFGSLTAQAAIQSLKTLISGYSGIQWPVSGSDGTWYIENGYNNASMQGDGFDHGCPKRCSQMYGMDLILNENQEAHGEDVISPVDGKIVYATPGAPGYSIGIQVDGTQTADSHALFVSLVHVDIDKSVYQYGSAIKGKRLGGITYQSNNSHLHWNLFFAAINNIDGSRVAVPFVNDTGSNKYGGYDAHIQGCGDYSPNGSINQFGGNQVINCGLEQYGYWAGPTPTGTAGKNGNPIHLYGSPAKRDIKLGYNTPKPGPNGTTIDKVDFWQCQVSQDQTCTTSQWKWIGSDTPHQEPNGKWYEFQQFTLSNPGYIGVDVHTTDGNWHEAENGIRALCVIYPNGSKQCPNLTTVTYHDGSVHSPGVGGGGVVENQGMTTSCSPGADQVALFTDKDFGGQCVTKDVGVYNTSDEIGLSNDSISSIQFGSRSSVRVYVCRDANITNTCEWIDSDVSDLSTHSVGDNQISSLKVEHGKGITICNSENYSGQCTKLSDGITNLADIGADQCVKSVLYDPSYVGHYHVVLWSGGGKGAGNPVHLDQSTPSLNYCGATRIFAVEIYRKMPPNATQNSPSNGATLASDTTELDLTYSGGDRFTVHVWNLTNHYDVWQGSLTSTTFHITGLTTGTYNWQVQGANDQGAGLWSDTWTFTIPVSPTSTPVPTQPPTPTSVPPASTLITVSVLLDGIGIAGDAKNPSASGNMNPKHPNRQATMSVYDGSSLVQTKTISLSYVNGSFNTAVELTNINVTEVTIYTPGFLTSSKVSITPGQMNTLTVHEKNGDVNRDGVLSQADYQAISDCYGSKVSACQYGMQADINDDGVVDGIDINLWLREA